MSVRKSSVQAVAPASSSSSVTNMREHRSHEAVNAADRLLEVLRSSNPDVLSHTGLLQRIREIGRFEQARKRKRPRPVKEPVRKRHRPLEVFGTTLNNDERERFIKAAQAVQNATWAKGSSLFAGFAFQQADDGLATLLDWCKTRSTDATREMRILTVLLEAYVHEEAETNGVPVNDVYRALSRKTGWSERKIVALSKCGRWHMSILESEHLGLGALALLGDNNHSTGARLPADVGEFVKCCLEIDGFQARSHDLGAYVHEGLQLCIQRLRFGEKPLVLSPDNRLRCILDRHEQSCELRTEDEAAPGTPQRSHRLTHPSVRSPDVLCQEQGSSSTIHVQQAIARTDQRGLMDVPAQGGAQRPHHHEYTDAVSVCSGDGTSIVLEELESNNASESRSSQRRQVTDVVLFSHKHVAVDKGHLQLFTTGRPASHPGPYPQITTQTRVPDSADCIRFAISGDIHGLIHLFEKNLASPRDVSYSRGFSLLRWALYGGMHNFKTVQFLIEEGAVVDEESLEHVWDFAYRGKCNALELVQLECIALKPAGKYAYTDWVDEQQFPLIHQIIFGRSDRSLMDEIRDNPDAVHATDAMGRTALDWATARAQLSYMKTLIDHGSLLNTIDTSGRSTLLHAVDSHSDDALRILLVAGAETDPEVPNRSSPLIAASFGCLPGMVELLIKFGAKVNACNPEGRTALEAIARQNTKSAEQCATILLDHGADPYCISSSGISSFETAIIYNSHSVLKLFLKRHVGHRLNWHQLLPTVTKFADVITTSILASAALVRNIRPGEHGFKDCESLCSQADYTEMLGKEFKDLC